MGFALNKFVDCFNGIFWPKKTGWVRAFRGKPIFVLVFEGMTVTVSLCKLVVGLCKMDVGPGSRDLNKENRLPLSVDRLCSRCKG